MNKKITLFLLSSTILFSCQKTGREDVISIVNPQPCKIDEIQQISNSEQNNFVLVEGGTFQMGDTFGEGKQDERPVHSVTLNSFYIGKYEVTQKEYQGLMCNNQSYFKGSDLPVESVSWFEAIRYCNIKSKIEKIPVSYNEVTGELLNSNGNVTTDVTKVKGYRLPTEAEWEYAAKGGNKSQGYKYSGSNNLDEVAWKESNSSGKTKPVGTKKANELGIYDMNGNVWELVNDAKREYNEQALTNPYFYGGSEPYIVWRGGAWNSSGLGGLMSSSRRHSNTTEANGNLLGFRIVRTVL